LAHSYSHYALAPRHEDLTAVAHTHVCQNENRAERSARMQQLVGETRRAHPDGNDTGWQPGDPIPHPWRAARRRLSLCPVEQLAPATSPVPLAARIGQKRASESSKIRRSLGALQACLRQQMGTKGRGRGQRKREPSVEAEKEVAAEHTGGARSLPRRRWQRAARASVARRKGRRQCLRTGARPCGWP